MMDAKLKRELKELEAKIDERTGKMKRLFMQGFLAQPAWVRATGWFLVGALTALMVKY